MTMVAAPRAPVAFASSAVLCCPPLAPQNSSPCFGSQGNATVHGPLSYILSQIFFQTVLSHLFINICFVAVVMHSHQAALHRLQATRLHCLGESWQLVQESENIAEATLDPLWLLLSLLWISSFVWMSTGMKVWKLLFEEKEKLV